MAAAATAAAAVAGRRRRGGGGGDRGPLGGGDAQASTGLEASDTRTPMCLCLRRQGTRVPFTAAFVSFFFFLLELWHFEFSEGGPKTRKSAENRRKSDFSIPVFIFFVPAP